MMQRMNAGRIPLAVWLSLVCIGAAMFATSTLGLTPRTIWHQPDGSNPRPAAALGRGLADQLHQRAALELRDDFRQGLREWRNRSNMPAQWSFDSIGFVHPGNMALYHPSLESTDYVVEFDAQVDRHALGFVFRASDFDNYYAVKLVIAEPGPLPRVEMLRYTVIGGREGPHTVHRLPLTVRRDTTYHVRLDVQGSDFTLMTQGKVADYWSDK